MRLVSTSPDNTEILCALGMRESLVGISRHCDYPEGLQETIPVISDFATVDVEKVIALRPDVVLCSTYYQADIVKTLVDHHLRVFVTQPETLDSIYQNIWLIGQLVGNVAEADVIVRQIQTDMPQQPSSGVKVFCEEWGEPLVVAAPWIQEMIALAGGVPVFPGLIDFTHTRDRIVSAESVVDTGAEMVLMPWCGCHGKVPVYKVAGRAGWAQLPAVQHQRLYPLEDSFFVRPGPRLTEGYRILRTLLAPYQSALGA